MSDPSDILRQLERIRPPTEPPSETPDDLARQEEQDASFMADLSPQKRNIRLYERTIASLEKRCIVLAKEKMEINAAHTSKQKMLEDVFSRHSALKQAYSDSRATNGMAALLMVLGGTSVSVAGAIAEPDWKPRFLWGGGALFASGFLFALQALFRNSPKNYELERSQIDTAHSTR